MMTRYDSIAEALVFVHGKSAAAEAARHALLCEKSGDFDTAEGWRAVAATLQDRDSRPLAA